MQALTRISHEHHDRLWAYINQLDELADCMNSDCLDTSRMAGKLAEMRTLHEGLKTQLIPHMEAVEAAVYPTLERIAADRAAVSLLAGEHREIRRLVDTFGEFIDHPTAHADRTAVLALRRVALKLYALLKTHLSEEELYIPILEDRLTPAAEAALARALDHVAEQPM
jgi:hypothetical protein